MPDDTEYISYGLWMTGTGECEMRRPILEIADDTVAPTTEALYIRTGERSWEKE